MNIRKIILLAIAPSLVAVSGCQTTANAKKKPPEPTSSAVIEAPIDMISTRTRDGVKIFGETFFGDLGAESPLVLLFHQGGSNGRGEYGSIAPWLNAEGYRAIAWDQRSGGTTYGRDNRTILTLPENIAASYCDAYPDLQAALDYVVNNNLASEVIVWGSSYSGALVFQLAAKNPRAVSAVIAFSPAAGGPMVECRARSWVSQVSKPMFVLKPESEMSRDSSVEQRDILIAAGVKFEVIENGVHGSSMLVDERTESDMREARNTVRDWLKTAASKN